MKILSVSFLIICTLMMNTAQAKTTDSIRIATFNVSMEALNYMPYDKERKTVAKGNELASALANNHQQIKNIAEIIQRVNPDIILLNEFDRADDSHQSLKHFIEQYLAVSQNGQPAINFPYFYQGPVNTGVKAPFDMNNNGILDEVPADTYGFGHFPGHFGMALLSKYPIDIDNVRTFQLFKWRDMPDALQPIDPQTNSPWYDEKAWDNMRLSSKSHWDLPINVNNHRIHILASHPTPPVFDGPEDRNGKRNHDEIRFWHDYISKEHSTYIYDDNKHYGGLAENVPFVIVGDQNASAVDGDAIKEGIVNLLTSDKLQDPLPNSAGGKAHQPDNPNAINHTAYWGMRADYVLPSTYGWHVKDSGVFWPGESDESYRLIKDRTASSDHRLVWVDLDLTNTDN